MANIQPVSIWKDGSSKQASVLNLRSVYDDLSSMATFSYELKEADTLDENGDILTRGSVLSNGNVSMSGADYSSWTGSNTEAYAFAASQLNLTIV